MTPRDRPGLFAPAERTLPRMLARQAEKYGARTLFVAGDVRWSFAEARAIAARTAGLLAAHGIAAGDRVAVMCGNRAEMMQVVLGCAWMGAVVVPINTACKGPQLRYLLANSGARLLVIESALADALAYVENSGLALERVWIVGGDAAPAVPWSCAALPQASATMPHGSSHMPTWSSSCGNPTVRLRM